MIIPSVSIKLEVRQSDIPVKGNAMVSGDDKYDRKVENQIIKRLNDGDIAAWFDALVTVSIEFEIEDQEYEFEAFDSLSGCSYASIKEFVDSSGYYGDMLETAWDTVIYDAGKDIGKNIRDIIAKPDLTKIKPVICE
jgi:hypothetical protein